MNEVAQQGPLLITLHTWPLSGPCHTSFTFCTCAHPQLLRTSEDVAKMQEELEIMRPLLEEAAKDTILTMEQIKVGVLLEPSPGCLTLPKDAQHL